MKFKIHEHNNKTKRKMSKKLISTLAVFLGIMAYSQVTVGLRANALFNTSSASWDNFKGTINGEKENTGFNAGLAFKIGSPVGGWFVMPEIYYTSIKNEATAATVTEGNVNIEAKSNRIDVPVMIGHNFLLGKLAAFAGPVASYNLTTDNTFANFKENATKEFTVGYQFGAQATLSKFVINARFEGAFSKDTRKFISNVSGEEIRYDNRPSMFILGIGYNFK
ncbi:MAG: hypothetical protein BGO86_03915 [Chryseobacterium sp. 36-9]|uniref:Outer membrane protein beta-barrel domain-containing protein n=2 Tax=Epilithonimonas pallida TaxID=373671 RepID=A0ABY1QZI6_9FLAO|nr:MAG: hypothetical protein BGO86_03915 [Chryseobacterium sp. 36-9]SMP90593.1 Outer membrane protein beta-barrel domain-containing protein [Epilithonimonas pallida]